MNGPSATTASTSPPHAMTLGAVALVIAAFPIFMLGALSFAVRDDLGITEGAIGIAVAISFATAALASTPSGKLVDAIGPARSLVIGSVITAAALTVIGTAPNLSMLIVGMILSGFGIALSEPGNAMALATLVPGRRQGLAFGIKEAAIPGVTMLAGIAVPSVALTVGWRWAFVGGLVLVPLLWTLIPTQLKNRRAPRASDDRPLDDHATKRALAVVAVGAGLGISAVTAMGTFLVDTGVAIGLEPGTAGLLLSVGSVVGIGSRVAIGWMADKLKRPALTTVTAMTLGGAVSLGLLAAAGVLDGAAATTTLVTGTVLAFGAGWGWTGLLFLSAVRATPHAPGAAAGIALAGLSVGGAAGPLAFGLLVGATSYPFAWMCSAAVMFAGAIVLRLGQRMMPGSPT